jgi:hypothetical protein
MSGKILTKIKTMAILNVTLNFNRNQAVKVRAYMAGHSDVLKNFISMKETYYGNRHSKMV